MLPVVAAVAGLALAVCLVNLVLTLGVIRRLREHAERIGRMPGIPHLMLGAGERVGPFEAITTTGEVVSRDRLSGRTLVGAFSIGCPPCEEQLPVFVEFASGFEGGRRQVIAVVMGSSDNDPQTEAYVETLERVARVVLEPQGRQPGRIGTELAVEGTPAFGILDGAGLVVGSELRLTEQPGGQPAVTGA